MAGHRNVTGRLVDHFANQVSDLVGTDWLTTTVLNAMDTGDDVVFAISGRVAPAEAGGPRWSRGRRDTHPPGHRQWCSGFEFAQSVEQVALVPDQGAG